MQHLGTKVLYTPRLQLRPFMMDDAQDMFSNWASREIVTRYLTWPTHTSAFETEGIVSAWCVLYDDPRVYNWAIVLRDTGTLIGNISCVNVSDQNERAEIGYCMSDDYWNQGIMTEALREVIRFLFEDVGLHKVAAYHDARNPASGRVMQKSGMQFEGLRRGELRGKDGSFLDIVNYGIVREDFTANSL